MKLQYCRLAAFFAVFFWASAFPGVKYCLRFFSPEGLMLFRFFVASVVMMGYCIYKKIPPPTKQLPLLIGSAIIGIFGYMWLFNTGSQMLEAGVSSFIIASGPVFTTILSILFLYEKVRFHTWIGIFISLLGLLLVAYSQVQGFVINWGVGILIVAAVATSVFNVAQRKLLATYSPIQTMSYAIFFATLPMFIFFPKLMVEIETAPFSADLTMVYLGIFPAALSYFLWGYALAKARKTTDVVGFLYLSPFLAVIMSYFFLGEIIAPLSLLGGLVIIGGIVIGNHRMKKRKI